MSLARAKREDAFDLSDASQFESNRAALKHLFEQKKVPAELSESLVAHFKERPFDLMRYGLLKIVGGSGKLMWFDLNDEQLEQLDWVEYCWYNKLPLRMIVLKARQIGQSTFCDGLHLCLLLTHDFMVGHLVTDIIPKAEYHVRVMLRMFDKLPDWIKPKIKKKTSPLQFEDSDKKLEETSCYIESAERGDKISRGFTFWFNHFSEIPYWNKSSAAEVKSALEAQIQPEWPFAVIKESTGNRYNDDFTQECLAAKNGDLGGYKFFFFPWFSHKAYKLALAEGISEQEFMDSLPPVFREMVETYKLSLEQINWYHTKFKEMVGRKGFTLSLFQREFPSNIQEAFIGSDSNFFEPEQIRKDMIRCDNQWQVKSLEKLPESVTRKEVCLNSPSPDRFCRCSLTTNAENGYAFPTFVEDETGNWTLWERPRQGHKYIVSADPAEGKQIIKGVRAAADFAAGGVWRYSYERDEYPMIVQVAQFHDRVDPRELARQMVAASVLYGDRSSDQKALIIFEMNSHGLASVEEAKDAHANLYYRVIYGKNSEELTRDAGFRRTGGNAGESSKIVILTEFRRMYHQGFICMMSALSLSEFGTFGQKDDGTYGGIGSNHDDTVTDAVQVPAAIKYAEGGNPMPVLIVKDAIRIDDDDDNEPDPKKVVAFVSKMRESRKDAQERESDDYEIAI